VPEPQGSSTLNFFPHPIFANPFYSQAVPFSCHKFPFGSVISIVTTTTEAISEMNVQAASFDIDAAFRAHYSRVVRIVARVVRDSARAEELAVEVFLKLWRNPKAQIENVEAWLYRVAVRTAVDELRRRTRRARYETLFGFARVSPAPPTPEQIHSIIEEQEKVRSILGRMQPRQAEFLVLRSHGFSYEELASILNLNPTSIGTLLSRAQQAFRKEYTQKYGQQ
jgi:RNA polymerase sigma-70 factor (ECF subfamily)